MDPYKRRGRLYLAVCRLSIAKAGLWLSPGERDEIWERALDVAEQRRVWLFNRPEPSVVPGVNKLELNVGEPALDISPQEAADLFATVVAA